MLDVGCGGVEVRGRGGLIKEAEVESSWVGILDGKRKQILEGRSGGCPEL